MDYSLVLGGGGAKGSYELGVFKALNEMDVNITSIYGTSIGALNGAMFVQGDINRAEKLWSEIKASDIMDIGENIEALLQKGGISSILEFMMHIISSRGLVITPFRRLLEEIIDEEFIRNSPINYGIVTFSLEDFKAVKLQKTDIPEGKLIDYLLASSALPAFKKHTIDNKIFIDGAFCDNLPISLAIDDKANNIIVVDILSPGIIEKVDVKELNVITIKNPFELRGSVLGFDNDDIVFNMELGYLDCKKAFGKIKGYRYYIEEESNCTIDKYISSVDVLDIKDIYRCFGIEIEPTQLYISKKILDKISRIIKLHSGEDIVTKEGVFRSAIEITADFLGINKVQVYTTEELLYLINSEYSKYFESICEEDYLEYIKNSVLLTDRKKILSALFDSINKENNLVFYTRSFEESKTPLSFRKLISIVYPRISIAAALLMFLRNKDKQRV
ncbi:MAG: patatin-like phospholipase family protein [Clostridium sp.]